MSKAEDLEGATQMLFVAPPEEFTKNRDALAERLKTEGDAEGARRVAALRKPVRSAWAVNRLAHEDRSTVEQLVQAGERLRAAQRRAISGTGAEGLREESEERGRLVNLLTRQAAAALGGNPSAVVVEEIAATLEAASADESAAGRVLEGRLSKPLTRPAGFGDVFELKLVPGQGGDTPSSSDDRAEKAMLKREVRAAERQEQKTRERVARLRAELETLTERLTSCKEELRGAEGEARLAADELKRISRRSPG